MASLASELAQNVVVGAAQAMGARVAHILGALTSWAIWIFAFIIALSHLGIAAQYMFTLFTGFVAMLALAGGLAFGLGGKEAAAELIKEIRSDMKGRR